MGVTVALGLVVAVLVAGGVLSLGFAPLAGLALVLLLAGWSPGPQGSRSGSPTCSPYSRGTAKQSTLHAVTVALGRLLGMLLGLIPPADEDNGWPAPARTLGSLLPLWEVVIPTAVPKWTKTWRSGGTARATPTANTAKAAARAGRSSPSRQSRG